jgi:antitoxin component of MazEF toxin-antitoxin module
MQLAPAIIVKNGGRTLDVLTRKTDGKARLTLPSDFANCLVTVERQGDELRVRKAKKVVARRYTFKQLMAGVNKKNVHAEIKTGPPVGREAL